MNQNPSFLRFRRGGLRESGNIPPVESEPVLGSNGGQILGKRVIPAKAGIQVSREDASVLPAQGTKLGPGANFRCLMSDAPIPGDYIKTEGRAGRMGARLMAIVAEGAWNRVYLSPTAEQEAAARKAAPEWKPEQSLPDDQRNFWTVLYGLTTWGDVRIIRTSQNHGARVLGSCSEARPRQRLRVSDADEAGRALPPVL